MGDIKWIKIYTDMVNNKKIKSIRKMPEGNNIVLIWVLLIAQAGESNKKGALYLTDTIPFTLDDLAVQLDFEKKVVQLALAVLEKYSMIEIFDDIIYIKNWEKYQNIEGMEKIREQTRVRVLRHREQQKLIACNVTVTLPVTPSNAIEQEQDIELDKDIEIKNISIGEIDKFFESVWEFYPVKKGKKSVSAKQKKILFDIGYDELKRCFDRYEKNKESWKEYQQGSTFFNSGYFDYLDENYKMIENQIDLKKISEGVFKL